MRKFGVAPDHRRGQALDAAPREAESARLRAVHEVGDDGHVMALHLQRRLGLHVEHAAHVQVGGVADAQAASRRALLHPRGDVDGAATDRAAFVNPAAEQHAAGVDADAHVEAGVAEAALHRLALGPAFGQQRQAGVHGALRVVFVRAAGAEGREQAVARVLQHLAVVALHQRRAGGQQAVHDVVNVFGVEVLAERGGADHVEEEHGDLLEQLFRCGCSACGGGVSGCSGCSGFGGRGRGQQGIAPRPQRRPCRLGHRVAEQRALASSAWMAESSC